MDISDAKAVARPRLHPDRLVSQCALAIAPDGRTLYVGTGKGLRSGATRPRDFADPQSMRTQPVTGQKYDYIGGILSGAVSAVRLPDAKGLAAYTRQV